jgi:tRNA 2-thiouridine synthesizing protein A
MTMTVEARGVLCPVPIIRLARAAASLPPGSLVELLTDDPAAEHDVPAWCRLRGHALLDSADLEEEPSGGLGLFGEPSGPEPDSPNPHPGQARRHLIRLGPGPGSPDGRPASAGGAESTRGSASR